MRKEKRYVTHKGVFEGKIRKRLSIEPKNMTNIDELIEIFRNKLPEEEEGTLKIYEKDLISGELTFVKTIMIYKDLHLTEEDSNNEIE
ncbi:MAG: hypothetical protein ACFFBP_11050 [Promethearchaeota archaeon]